jgi:NitT/TauT family transport system permease protein
MADTGAGKLERGAEARTSAAEPPGGASFGSAAQPFLRVPISRRRFFLLAGLVFTLIGVGWALLATSGWVPALFLPSPATIAARLKTLLSTRRFLLDVGVSVWRVGCGFLLAAAMAIPLGLLIGCFRSAEAALQPLMELVRYMPVPAFLPLCILWFGIGDAEKILVIFLGTFFQLVVLVADDARTVPREILAIGYSFGLRRSRMVSRIVLPHAGPQIFDHLRVACGWAWSYLVVAEIVAANRGVGFMIMQSQRYLRTADVIAGILVIGVLGLVSDIGFRFAGRLLFPWDPTRSV